MKKINLIPITCLAALAPWASAEAKQRPNIVFILADDLGYGDISALNPEGKIPTPNIDRIAQNGLVFTDAHSSSAVSSPTRYGILTGRYCWRTRLKEWVLNYYDAPLIPSSRINMASMLKQAGYATGCVGKWHLGWDLPTLDGKAPANDVAARRSNIDFSRPITNGPNAIGFDYYYGVDAPTFPPFCFIENDRMLVEEPVWRDPNKEYGVRTPGPGVEGWTYEAVLTTVEQKAVEFIQKSAKEKDPFFLYFPLTSPHDPIAPSAEFLGKSGLNKFADFVMQSDAVVGSVMRALEEAGVADNTILVFTADNGVARYSDIPFLQSRGHYSSYVFRDYKGHIYDGGHHVACVMQWPAKLEHRQIDEMICLNDFITTFGQMTGYRFKDNEAEDRYSLMPLLFPKKGDKYQREAVVHHSVDGSFAIRKGKWKLVLTPDNGNKRGVDVFTATQYSPQDVFQLYDMEKDISETTNLHSRYPEITNKLKQLLISYIDSGRSTPGKSQQNDVPYPERYMLWLKYN